jgi:hypothetical protein
MPKKQTNAALQKEIVGALDAGKKLLLDIEGKVDIYEGKSSQGLVGLAGGCFGLAGGACLAWHFMAVVMVAAIGGTMGIGICAPIAMLIYRRVTSGSPEARISGFSNRMNQLSAQTRDLKRAGAPEHVIKAMWANVGECAAAIGRISSESEGTRPGTMKAPLALPPAPHALPLLPGASTQQVEVGKLERIG